MEKKNFSENNVFLGHSNFMQNQPKLLFKWRYAPGALTKRLGLMTQNEIDEYRRINNIDYYSVTVLKGGNKRLVDYQTNIIYEYRVVKNKL